VKRFVLACALMALMVLAYAGWKWFREKRVPKWALNLAIALTGLALLPELAAVATIGYVAEGAMK
jgi:biotin transporter BioY